MDFLKTLSFIPKLVVGLVLPKTERSQWAIALCKEMGIDILKPDFESIYAHALVEYGIEYPEKTLWIRFFSLKDTTEYIKTHLYKKPENELVGKFDTLLHTGQGDIFLRFKKANIQTENVEAEYKELKKHLDFYTKKSTDKNSALAQNTQLSNEILKKLEEIRKDDSQFEEVLEKIDWQGQAILTELDNLKESLSQNQDFWGILAQKISEANLSEEQKIEIADKIYNFGTVYNPTFQTNQQLITTVNAQTVQINNYVNPLPKKSIEDIPISMDKPCVFAKTSAYEANRLFEKQEFHKSCEKYKQITDFLIDKFCDNE